MQVWKSSHAHFSKKIHERHVKKTSAVKVPKDSNALHCIIIILNTTNTPPFTLSQWK